MKKVLIIIILITTTLSIYSDESKETYDKYIGAGFGMTTGFGLSYRYWPQNWGGQVLFTPIWDDDTIGFNLGFAGFRRLHETKYTRLFLYLATSSYMDWNEAEEFEVKDDNTETNEDSMTFEPAIGFGPGLEIFLFDHIVIDVMFGFGLTNNGLNFTAETGLYYRF